MKTWLSLLVLLTTNAGLHAAPPDRKAPDAKLQLSKEAQKAVDAGLAYLAKEQAKDGSFGTGQLAGNVAVTSLSATAFLAAGYQPDKGEYGQVIGNAIRYLVKQEDANRIGFITSQRGAFHGPMYGHGFATLFLAEVTGKISDKDLNRRVRTLLGDAVDLIVKNQNNEGGWRYQPQPHDADLSVTAVQVVALRAAKDAGIAVPQATFDNAIKYIKSCQDPQTGGFRYQRFGGAPGFARTAAGLGALNRLGIKESDEIRKGMVYLRQFEPGKIMGFRAQEAELHYFYGHYYAAKTLWFAGDKEWDKWYPAVRDELLSKQKNGQWIHASMDTHYNTAMALIILQMPLNHLPSMKR